MKKLILIISIFVISILAENASLAGQRNASPKKAPPKSPKEIPPQILPPEKATIEPPLLIKPKKPEQSRLPIPDPRKRGGSSDGTGDIFTASDQQIRDSVSAAHRIIQNVVMDFWYGAGDGKPQPGKLVPPELMYLLSERFLKAITWYDGSSDTVSRFDFKNDGLCEDGRGHEGAASIVEIDGELGICIALQTWRQIPVEYLAEVLAGILVHEYSHVMDQDEATAVRAQKWFSLYHRVRLDIGRFAAPTYPGDNFRGALKIFREQLQKGDVKEVCQYAKKFADLANEADRAIVRSRHAIYAVGLHVPDVNQKEHWLRKTWKVDFVGFCEGKADSVKFNNAFESLYQEYESYMIPFGRALPREIFN